MSLQIDFPTSVKSLKKKTYIYMFYSVIITGCTFHINKEQTALVWQEMKDQDHGVYWWHIWLGPESTKLYVSG